MNRTTLKHINQTSIIRVKYHTSLTISLVITYTNTLYFQGTFRITGNYVNKTHKFRHTRGGYVITTNNIHTPRIHVPSSTQMYTVNRHLDVITVQSIRLGDMTQVTSYRYHRQHRCTEYLHNNGANVFHPRIWQMNGDEGASLIKNIRNLSR